MILAYSHIEVLFLSRITFLNGLSWDMRHNRFHSLFVTKARATTWLLEKKNSVLIDGKQKMDIWNVGKMSKLVKTFSVIIFRGKKIISKPCYDPKHYIICCKYIISYYIWTFFFFINVNDSKIISKITVIDNFKMIFI